MKKRQKAKKRDDEMSVNELKRQTDNKQSTKKEKKKSDFVNNK